MSVRRILLENVLLFASRSSYLGFDDDNDKDLVKVRLLFYVLSNKIHYHLLLSCLV
jgi:hypothetical protein